MDLVWIILKWVVLIVVLIGGALQSEYSQKNLKTHGLCKRYYENGNLEFEGYYEYDLPCGEQKTYYENGVLKEKTS